MLLLVITRTYLIIIINITDMSKPAAQYCCLTCLHLYYHTVIVKDIIVLIKFYLEIST